MKIIKENGTWKKRNTVGTRGLITQRKRDLLDVKKRKYGKIVKRLTKVEIARIEIEMKIRNEIEEMQWNIELNVKEKRERKSVTVLPILPMRTSLEETWSKLQSVLDQWMETDKMKDDDSDGVMFGDLDSVDSYRHYRNIDSLYLEDSEDYSCKKKTIESEEDVQEEKKPLAGRISDRGDAGKMGKMRVMQEIKTRDALRTPSRVRNKEPNLEIYSSPSLKHVKVTNLRKMFEIELTDKVMLPTTSPSSTRSDYVSRFNPSNCADQWYEILRTGPRQAEMSGQRTICDWTGTARVDEMVQSDVSSQDQAGNG